MQSGEWAWWAGSNDENYSEGPFDTREEAIAALDGYGGYICEAKQTPLRLSEWVGLDRLLETAEDNFADSDRCSECDADSVFKVTPDQEKDLTAILKESIDAWQNAHVLVFTCYTFSHQRNLEGIPEDEPVSE